MKKQAGNLLAIGQPGVLMAGLAITVFLALSTLLLLNSMNKPPSRDEQMYCTAGVLMAQGLDIYRDFSYVSQLPYHPLMLATVYKVLGTTHYLLTGRLVTVFFEVLTMACIVALCVQLLGEFRKLGLYLGVMAIVFYATNPLVYMANGYAWNHGVVVFLVMLSLYLFVSCPFEARPCYGRLFFIGLLLSTATCTRITTALIQTVFLVMVFLKHSSSQRENTLNRLSFLAGSVIALAWPLWVISKAGDSFLVNLIEIPRVYGAYLRDTGASHNKIDMALACVIQPGYLALLAAIGFVWLQTRKMDAASDARNRQTLVWLIPASCFIIAFIPPTLWRQYLAVPVPFLCVTLAALFCRLCQSVATGSAKPLEKAFLGSTVFALIAIGIQLVTLLRHPPQLAPSTWAPIRLHNTSQRIAEAIHGSGPVLTLVPLYALEGGRAIYPELSCGSIVFRIGDLLSPQQQAQARAVGPGTLPTLIRSTPPSAVLLGVETPGYEVPIRALTDSAWQSLAFENGIELRLEAAHK
jgi:hypothetical protein